MIPFVSQRGGGQDLATHLMNTHDNEDIELFQVRGAVARDLHGAFAEWEAIASALTRAQQYLCSLSVNPDELQGRLTRAQYLDYIERAEERLGLTGQPRAIIFHRKRGADGREREHCHIVWSRTDASSERAVPLSFSKEKLMTVTREFARDHGLALPDGYYRQEDALRRRNRQLSAYDCVKQKETGISHEERMAAVTDAWRRSDSAGAFVTALEDLGYVLARGRNSTRVVLVDFYGHTTALTRLIDDASVRAKHVREFLGASYAPDTLPTVEQAQEHAAQRRSVIEAFEAARLDDRQAGELASRQVVRRAEAEAQAAHLRAQHHDARVQLAARHKDERQKLKASFAAAQHRIRIDRARRRPRGLAAFLGRVSGVAAFIRKVQRYRDRKRYAAYLIWYAELKRRQKAVQEPLAAEQALQMADIERGLRALDQIEQRERDSLRQAQRRERRQRINARHVHMPPVTPVGISPEQSSLTVPPKAGPDTMLARQMAEAAQLIKDTRKPVRLTDAFARAAETEDRVGDEEGGDTGTTELSRKRRRHGEREVRGRPMVDDRDHNQDQDDEIGPDEAQKKGRHRDRRRKDMRPGT